MDETRHYFGAYAEIKLRKTSVTSTTTSCKNGHICHSPYCPTCGGKTTTKQATRYEYPTGLIDITDEEGLADITPEQMFSKGVAIAIPNLSNIEWLELDDMLTYIKQFPTDAEVETMINKMAADYRAQIRKLRLNKYVESVTLKAGYVEDAYH